MGEVRKLSNGQAPQMEGRTVYDIMQKIVTGSRSINKGSNLVDPSGKSTGMEQEPIWTFRSLNLRTETIMEAEGICRDIVQPGMEGDFIIAPVYVVLSREKWAEIDKHNKLADESSN